MTTQTAYQPILDFWFGEIIDGLPAEPRGQLWFGGDVRTDTEIQTRFGAFVEQALNNGLKDWQESPKGSLALIIVLDQFTRSIYRKTPRAFAGDTHALRLSKDSIKQGWDKDMSFSERQFLYMPLMHAEDLASQSLCVQVMTDLADETSSKQREIALNSIAYAKDHRELIARFGRFPHRNQALGRANTPEETAYLEAQHDSYGQ